MDYFLNELVKPIEFEDTIVKTKQEHIKKFPDFYRRYLFNKPDFVLSNNNVSNASKSNTKLKYWQMNANELKEYFMKIINSYQIIYNKTNCTITKYFKNIMIMDNTNKKYYNKIYDISDIIICRHDELNILTNTTNYLINNSTHLPTKYITIRLSFYMATYLVKLKLG